MKSISWEMIGAIFGGLAFLLALLVDFPNLGKWRRIIFSFILGGVVFIGIYLAAPPLYPPPYGPTATSVSSPMASSPIPDTSSTYLPVLYDTFSNKIYENSYDNNLWSIDGGNSAKVAQHDGVLVLSDNAPGVGNGFTLFLTQWHSTTFAVFRASVKIEHTTGSSNISLNANSPSLPDGWSEIALDDTLSGAHYHVKNGDQQITAGPAEYDTWTSLEIRYIPNENLIGFYLGNSLLATQKVSSDLSILTPSIQLWHPDNNQAAGSVKDVQISTQYLQP